METFHLGNIMTPEDGDRCEINISNEYHILRHFSIVDPFYSKTLIGNKYWYYHYTEKQFVEGTITGKDIKQAISTKGSKFFPAISGIENPKKLLELIKEKISKLIENNELYWIASEHGRSTSFSFDYGAPVGEENVTLLHLLSDEQKAKVKKVPRSEHPGEQDCIINTIEGITKQSTSFISVGILDTGDFPFFFLTAYPRGSSIDMSEIPFEDMVFIL